MLCKRMISFLLTLVLLVGMVPPVEARAEEAVETAAAVETTAPVETTVQTEPVAEAVEVTLGEVSEEATDGVIVCGLCSSEYIYDNNGTYIGTEYTVWTLYDDGLLEITFTSTYPESSAGSSWYNYRDQIKKAIIPYGFTPENWQQEFRKCTNLTEVDIGTEEIPYRMFEFCTNLEKVTLRDTVTSIGGRAFWECNSLEEINIPESVCSIGEDAFYYCNSLCEVVIPDTVLSLSEGAFLYCEKMVSITLPSGITEIPDRCFDCCESLTEINLPEGIQRIGERAFYNCSSLTQINFPEGLAGVGDSAFGACYALKNVILPESLRTIGAYAFESCGSAWEVVYIPAGVTSIGKQAFKNSYRDNTRRAYNVSEDNAYYSSDARGVLFDKEQTVLIAAPALLSGVYTVPDTVRSIDEYAFYHCDSITEVRIPDEVNSIGFSAFYECRSLSYANIPAFLTVVEDYTFYCCPLAEIVLPEGLTKIGDYAFCWYGSYLEREMPDLIIPASVQEIGPGAFVLSTPRNVYFQGDAPKVNLVNSYDSPPFYYMDSSWSTRVNCYYDAKNTTFTGEAKACLAYEGVNWIPLGEKPQITISLPEEQIRTDPLICGTMKTEYGNGSTLWFGLTLTPYEYYADVTLKVTLPEGFSFSPDTLEQETLLQWPMMYEETFEWLPPIYPIYIDEANQAEEYAMTMEITAIDSSGLQYTRTEDIVFYRPVNTVNTAIPVCKDFPEAEDYVFTLDSATGSGSIYNQETARLCAMMSSMAYDEETMELFLTSELGFSNFEKHGLEEEYDLQIHECGRYYASKKVIVDGTVKDLIYVICRGTPMKPGEWYSNTQVDSGKIHQGFESASKLIKKELQKYCERLETSPEDTIFVVTGHSRGAAVANLVGHWLNASSGLTVKSNVSVYTFATPTVSKTIVSEQDAYLGNENIFNFVYYQDVIRNAPSMQYYGRYGTTRIYGFSTSPVGSQTHDDGFGVYTIPFTDANFTMLELLNSLFYVHKAHNVLDSTILAAQLAMLIGLLKETDYSAVGILGIEELYAHEQTYYDAVVNDAPGGNVDAINQRTEEAYEFFLSRAGSLDGWNGIVEIIKLKCPINLYVHDTDGNLVASIVNKEITSNDDNLILYVDGESLNVAGLKNVLSTYTFRVEGYDDGTMKHCIQTVDLEGLEQVILREDIPIVKNGILEMTGNGVIVLPGEDEQTARDAYETYTDAQEMEDVLESLNHTHEFGGWTQTKAPGCVEAGSEERTCATCGEVEKRDIDPLGHDYATWSGETSCRVCGEKFGVDILQEYLAIRESVQLTAEVTPSELAEKISWSVEKGGEDIISVDAAGNVTPLSVGTAYVIASVTDGELILSDRCRIDVAAPVEIDGIQLSTNKVTTELFSTDYSEFEILLQLPQNLSMSSDAEAVRSSDEDWGVSIESAEFENWDMAGVFELKVLDDRRVAVVPTDYAVYFPEEVKNSYVTTVQVKINGEIYTSEKMTLTVKRSKPKLKATVPTFNSFYSWQEQKISVAGGTVTEIDGTVPDWLFMYDDTLQLESDIPLKNLSGKAVLEIYTEEWRIPATVSVAVKSVYKPPALKLNVSSVTLCQDSSDSQGVQLQIQSKEKGVDIADLKIKAVLAEENYLTENLNPEDGTFTLIPIDDFPSGKVTLNVSFEDTINDVPLSLSVKNTPVNLKLSKSAITLNSGTGDSVVVGVDITPVDFIPEDLDFRLVGNDKSDRLYSGELDVEYKDGKLYISTTDQTPDNAKYTLYISAAGGKETALKITTTNAEPTLKLKANGNLDLSFPDRKIGLTTTFKNHSGGNLKAIDYTVTESSGKMILDEDSKAIRLTKDGADLFVQLKDTAGINIKNTYTLNLKLTLADDSILESSVKIPVKQTNISLKLSANKLTLNKAIDDKATITVTCATKDYNFVEPALTLLDSKGNDASGQLDISWSNGKLTVATTEATPYGGSYKLQIAPEKGAKAVTLAIAIPAEAKSTVTGTLKATGNLDVIRDGTALTITPTWKNCNDAERTEELKIFCGDEDVTNCFVIEEEDGKYILSRGENLDHTQKYTATLTATFANGETVIATGALKLKMGSAKLTLNADSTTLFANDKHSRVNISFASADSTLNGVTKVELDSKLANQFELFDYGNGQYAIGFKDGNVPAKLTSANISLNVWLEGNESAKANAAVKVKLTIVR